MIEFDFCYFFQSIPGQIANSYLKKSFNWNYPNTGNQPLHFFVRYYQGPTPPSYIALQHRFPAHCFIESNSTLPPRFVLAAGLVDFSIILNFIFSQSCTQLAEEINREISTNTVPVFRVGDETWSNGSPKIMGILNITPDSFFDGGNHYHLKGYSNVAEKMIRAGADIIDVGGESTRPGSQIVSEEEEISRILPVVQQIRKHFHVPISIDTVKPKVAAIALEEGADMVNDISGLSAGKEMLDVVTKHQASYCLMHIQGKPENMQNDPQYFDVVAEIYQFFKTKLQLCQNSGLNRNRILIDPGIGFGKTVSHNLDILRFVSAFSNLKSMIAIGTSNKSFIGHALGREVHERLSGTLSTHALGWMLGASVFRVHNVLEAADTVKMARLFTHDLE